VFFSTGRDAKVAAPIPQGLDGMIARLDVAAFAG
jgi:hypothetical protein